MSTPDAVEGSLMIEGGKMIGPAILQVPKGCLPTDSLFEGTPPRDAPVIVFAFPVVLSGIHFVQVAVREAGGFGLGIANACIDIEGSGSGA